MRQQDDKVLAAAEIDQHRIALGAGMPAAAVTSVGVHRHDTRGRFDPVGRFDLHGQTVFVTGPVDTNLIADHKGCQQCNRPDPFEIHCTRPRRLRDPVAATAWHNDHGRVKPACPPGLIPGAF